jgi:hypothetical protein
LSDDLRLKEEKTGGSRGVGQKPAVTSRDEEEVEGKGKAEGKAYGGKCEEEEAEKKKKEKVPSHLWKMKWVLVCHRLWGRIPSCL